MPEIFAGLFGFLFFIIWIGIIVFFIILALRLVNAVEKIASLLEQK